MDKNIFKVHTENLGRLSACIKHARYGITSATIRQKLPADLAKIKIGDIVFISEKEISNNALFGPFYIVNDRPSISIKKRKGTWAEIDTQKTSSTELPYWVEIEKRTWCIFFDKTLSDRISIVWPYNWKNLKVNLPSWGIISGNDAEKLIDFAIKNEIEAKEFLNKHNVW